MLAERKTIMELEKNLKLERYKLVTDRQKYFTELSRDAFGTYLKVFIGLSAGLITLVSAKSPLQIDYKVLSQLITGIGILITFLGISISVQICFFLIRWYGFRRAEKEINPDSPDVKRWAWIFEGFYIFMICTSVVVIWIGICSIKLHFKQIYS